MFRVKTILRDGDLIAACLLGLLVLAFLAFAPADVYDRLVDRSRFLLGLAPALPGLVLAIRGAVRVVGVSQKGQAVTAAIAATAPLPGSNHYAIDQAAAKTTALVDAVLEGGTAPIAIRQATNPPIPALADAPHLPDDTPLDGDQVFDYTNPDA